MRIATLTRSFAAGEISPELFGRIDLTKFQTGLKTCRNFQVLPHGPVVNSPGWDYILETKNSAKKSVLIPFIYNTSQAYQLEFGDQYIRFHTQAGTVLEAASAITGITQANPGVVTQIAHGYVNGQCIFLTGIGGMTQLNGRFVIVAGAAANTYQLTYFDGANINTTAYGAYTAGGTGARVYEVATPYLEADLADIHWTQSADVMTLTHPSYDKRELARVGATNWTLNVISMAQIQTLVSDFPTVINVGGAAGTPKLAEYLITFVSAVTREESASYRPRSRLDFGGLSSITGVTNANPGVFTTAAAHGLLSVGQIVYLTGVPGLNGWFDNLIAVVNSIPLATTFTLKDLNTGAVIDTTNLSAFGGVGGTVNSTGGWIQGVTSANPGVFTVNTAHGFIVGDPVVVEGLQFAGAGLTQPYFSVINSVPSPTTFTLKDEITGLALDTSVFSAVVALTGLVRLLGVYNDLTVAGHSNNLRLIPAPLPSVVTYVRYNIYKKFNGLFGFVGASSVPGTFIDNNIAPSFVQTPSIPNDPISAVNNYPGESGYWQGRRWFMDTIRHFIPLSDLVLLTSGGEWKIPGSSVVTPSNLSYNPEDYIGASNVKPIITGGSVLYAADRGGRVRELNFVWQQQGYRSSDISVMNPQLFDNFTILSMAYTRAPYSLAWFVRSDGVLLGLTYAQEQQVAAWHHRDTQGIFESVCATPEGTDDVLYAIIKRLVNGRTVRYFERQRSRNIGGVLANSFFMDAGATYNGAPVTNISGLYHLEGAQVSVLADGVVIPGSSIVGGVLTPVLGVAASVVSIGLGYTSQLETLPLASEAIPAGGQGATKNVDEVIFRVYQSSDIFVGPRFDKLREVKQRTTEPYGSPPGLMTGIVRQKIDPSWSEDGTVCVQQTNPLPLDILSMSLKVAVGG